LTIRDITVATNEAQVIKPATSAGPATVESGARAQEYFNVEDAGFTPQPPARTWRLRLAPSLQSEDGQTLGYTWIALVDNAHERAFVSFGDGHGVWERSSGSVLPFSSRNFTDVSQWVTPLTLSSLMPTLLNLQGNNFSTAPDGSGTPRTLPVTPDTIQAHGIDISSALSPSGTGLVWATVMPGTSIEGVATAAPEGFSDPGQTRARSTVVQATNLGLSVKDSPQNTLIFVTSLDDGTPVAQARVSVVNLENTRIWQGTTDSDGIAMAPALPLRSPDNSWEFRFIVTAEKDGAVAYVGSDWNEGIQSWDFDLGYSLEEASPLLRGSVFTDRGVYKPGEEIHVKVIVRTDTPNGIRLLPSGTTLSIRTHDSRDRLVDERTVTLGAWSTAEWTWTVPASATLGNYRVEAEWPGAAHAADTTDKPHVAAHNLRRVHGRRVSQTRFPRGRHADHGRGGGRRHTEGVGHCAVFVWERRGLASSALVSHPPTRVWGIGSDP